MRKAFFAGSLLALSLAASSRAQDLLSGSLVEGLAAIEKPELGGVFTYVGTKNAPRAFADLVARDPKALKRWTKKIDADRKVAKGLTAWDHEVCATLVNYYAAGGAMPGVKRPNEDRMKALNACVLAPVLELQEIAERRKK